ncbi:MAG: BatD family protein [Crocinitomicaceae bacterium]|nr:BatD family protein [Crocinitomicaceae bacterium]
MLNRYLTIFSILTVVCTYAQKKVELKISPKSVEIGETFSIIVTSTVQGQLVFDKVPSSFIQDYHIDIGNTSQIDHATGNVKTLYFYSFTGMITKAGKYNIGPAYITNGSRSYPSNKVTITVGKKVPMSNGEVSAQQLKDPAFGLIQVNKKTIYEGEPLLISAKVFAKYNPSHVGAYKSYVVPGTTVKHSIGNTTSFKKSIEKYKGIEYYAFPYDKNVIFPSGIGKFQIEPFTMNLHQGYQNFPLVSNSFTINILPLPSNPPIDFIGGVGDFTISREIDAQSIKQGEVLKMTVTISGIGNLQNITDPVLNLPKGFTVYGDPIITKNTSIGMHGTEGEIIYEFNIEVKKAGNISLPVTTISFFDPNKEKYIQATTNENLIDVKKDFNYIETDPEANEIKDTELVIHRSKIKEEREIVSLKSFFGAPGYWGGIGAPILASFLFIFLVRRKDKSEEKAIAKRQKSAKDNAFKERLVSAKSLIDTGSDSDYYSEIENALRKAFEIEMKFSEDRRINKTDINDFIEKTGDSDLKESVSSIFANCEQSKYGFSSANASRHDVLQQLQLVINKLKHVKW